LNDIDESWAELADADLSVAKTEATKEGIRQKDTELVIDAEQANANIEIEQARATKDTEPSR
jgi:hypothetical protein